MGLLLLVRHGQASFGADDYDVLSETGWEQARVLGRALAAQGVRPGVVLSGGLSRQRDTVAGMLEGLGSSVEPQVDERWDEFDHLAVVAAHPGPLPAGDDRRAFQQAFVEATGRWTSGEHDEAYAESWPAFLDRVDAAARDAAGSAGSGSTVVAVSSGGPIAAVVSGLVDRAAGPAERARLWSAFNTTYVNSAVTRVVVGSTGARLLTFNEHTHLAGDLVTYR